MQPNHLLGYRRTLLQLSFVNVSDLLNVRKSIMPIAEKNKKKVSAMDTYAEVARYEHSEERPGSWTNSFEAQTLGLISLTKTKITINDRTDLLMPAISLLTFENTMSLIMFE